MKATSSIESLVHVLVSFNVFIIIASPSPSPHTRFIRYYRVHETNKKHGRGSTVVPILF
ncbi:unnamed protein product [Amoebophrya sp. A25]|nr:unnamed protein product [Amoebophrya sp. A25]|eukprot:GSA25T00028007001.1